MPSRKAIALIAVFSILTIAAAIYSSSMLQNNISSPFWKGNSPNNVLATYKGYLVSGQSFMLFEGENYTSRGIPTDWLGSDMAIASMTFADGRTFIVHENVAVSKGIEVNETYTVYYNVSAPDCNCR